MTTDSVTVRLLIEAIVVTVALSVVGGTALYAYVGARQRQPRALAIMNRTVDEMSARMAGYERDRARDHLTLLRLQAELQMQREYSRALTDYSSMLADQLRELGQTNIPPPPKAPQESLIGTNAPDDMTLVQGLMTLFNDDELDDLAFRLGLDLSELDGKTHSGRARGLVTYMRRRDRLNELIEVARSLRPEGGF